VYADRCIRSAAMCADVSARSRAAVRFDEISRSLVHSLKYGDRLDLAPMMGRWMAQAGRELLTEADALVPVPLHWRRSALEQAEMLSGCAAEGLRQDGESSAVNSFKNLVAAPGEQSGAGSVAEFYRVGAAAGVTENFGAVGIGDDGFEMELAFTGFRKRADGDLAAAAEAVE